MRGSVRRAFLAGRESLRAARERVAAADNDNGEAPVHGPGVTGQPGAVQPGQPGDGRLAAGQPETAAPGQPLADLPAYRPVDAAVPRSLRIAAAWSWRLIVVATVTVGLLWLVNR